MTKKSTTSKKPPAKPAPKPPAKAALVESVDYTLLPNLTDARVNFEDKPLTLTREALLLNYRAFDTVKADAQPARRGLTILGLILVILLVARGLQLLLGFATTPRFDVLSTQVLDRVTELDWYGEQVAANPQFATQFGLAYDSVWQLIRVAGGYPSTAGTLSSMVFTVLSLLAGWIGYGLVAHVFARWFGGKATLKEFLGPLALAYAPMLLLGLTFIPGFDAAWSLVFLLMLITKYLAIRRTYFLSPAYSLVVLIAPYVIAVAGVAILAALGLGVGLGQIPYLDPILRFFTGL